MIVFWLRKRVTSLMCASTAKLFSTSCALKLLGKDYRAKTRFYADGVIDSLGILQGDLWIRGGGDVSLGSKYFNEKGWEFDFMNHWLDSLTFHGINGVNGRLIVDGSEFGYDGVPDGWDWSDMGNYYGVGAAGINYFDNTLKYYFKTGKPGAKVNFWYSTRNNGFFFSMIGGNIVGTVLISMVHLFKCEIWKRKLPAYKDRFCVKGSFRPNHLPRF